MMKTTLPHNLFYHSPIGVLRIITRNSALSEILFWETKKQEDNPDDLAMEVQKQLQEYFGGNRTAFDLPTASEGTDFQRKVWKALLDIPFGKTVSYLELSKRIENPKAVRAVGHANGRNPIPIIVPCHRVIGSSGKLTGYAGGLWRKKYLLELEGVSMQEELHF